MPTPTRLPFDDEPAGAPASSLPDAADRADAVDPRLNVVLEASAGTGKTRVLVDRYVNLVQAGVEPASILAITFTRKAAAEMRERILQRLMRVAAEGGIDQRRWRALRERLSEVAISTIDAFCLSLLREFPLEAGLDPGFGVADETEALRLTDEALERALRICRAVAREDRAVALVFAELGDFQLRRGLAALLDRRLVAGPILARAVRPTPRELAPDTMAFDALARIVATLRRVPGGLLGFLATGPVRHPRFRLLASDITRAASAVDAPGASSSPADWQGAEHEVRLLVDGLEEYFFTQSGTPRKRWTLYKADDGPDKASLRAHREKATALAEALADDLAAFRRDLNAVLTRGVWRLFGIARHEYRTVLEEHAVVDFPEALERTLALLSERGEFTRSRYLLEARYQHLLVDEFQDTSDAQWQLIWHLVQAWREGISTDQDQPLRPTIFVVGDRKQSIYGFRDADARVLGRAAAQIRDLRGGGEVRRAIRQSFRAVPPLLAFTNDLCAAIDKAVERDDAFTYDAHDEFPVPPETGLGGDALGLVVGRDLEQQASAVAGEIARILSEEMVRDRQSGVMRRAGPGDIAVLFRMRDGHQAFEQALAARGIPSYAYKGLGFFDADEVKDVFALLRYLAGPASDLRAAELLRSRLARVSDEALARLSPGLAQAVLGPTDRDQGLDPDDLAVLQALRASVPGWLALADRVTPCELIDHVLASTAYAFELGAQPDGPARRQARENLKKVRGLIRRIQNRGYATLARVAEYLDRLSAGDESAAAVDALDAVNLMTTHAAKGLEFPVVFLVNLNRGAGGGKDPIRVAPLQHGDEIAVSVGTFRSAADEDQTAREREESKRLLYVAVTRARDRLYLGASLDRRGRFAAMAGGLGEVLPGDLRTLLEQAGSEGAEPEVFWRGLSGTHRFIRVVARDEVPPSPPARAEGDQTAPDLDRLVGRPAVPRQPISAAGWSGRDPGAGPWQIRPDPRRLGTLVHRLLERPTPPGGRSGLEALAARLARLDPRGDAVEAEDLARAAAEAVLAIGGTPGGSELLEAPRRWHEVPVTVRVADTLWRGAVDALVDTGDQLEVLEFKTGRPHPAHDAQLDLYLAAIRALRPGSRVRGRLVYRAGSGED